MPLSPDSFGFCISVAFAAASSALLLLIAAPFRHVEDAVVTSTVRQILELASQGLVYSSESDRPFTFISFPGITTPVSALTPQDVARLAGAPNGPASELPKDQFLSRHLSVDSRDRRAIQLIPRYDALMTALETQLPGFRVFRVGKIEVRVLALGNDARDGTVAGLETVAVET